MSFTMFDVAEPGAIKALGSNVRTACFIKGVGVHEGTDSLIIDTVYLLKREVFEKINNSILNGTKKISKGDKVYFVPGCHNSGFKMREAVKSNNGKITKDFENANIIVFPKVLGLAKPTEDGNSVFEGKPFTKSKFYYDSKEKRGLLEEIDPKYNPLVYSSCKSFSPSSDDVFFISGIDNYNSYRVMINNYDINSKLLEMDNWSPWRLSGHVVNYDLIYDYSLVTGSFINLVYTAAKNKATVVDERTFMKENLEASTVLDENSIEMLIKMFNSSEDNRKLAAMLLCNSDYKEKEHYLYMISNRISGYTFDQLKRLKEVKNFLSESRFMQIQEMKNLEFLRHLYDENKDDYLKDKYFNKFITEAINNEIKNSQSYFVRSAIDNSLLSMSWTIKLPESEGVD